MLGLFKKNDLNGDFWGGLASMLVALPAAIAFGVKAGLTIWRNGPCAGGSSSAGELIQLPPTNLEKGEKSVDEK